jgi:thymidylate synthase (FAD)
MIITKPTVRLLSRTENPIEVIYVAYKQCYSKDFIEDEFDKINESNDTYDETTKKIHKFIEEVIESGHDSPLEHVQFTFGIAGISRSLTHQLVRHRIASYSQQSQRYVDASNANFVIPKMIEQDEISKAVFESYTTLIMNAYKILQTRQEKLGNKHANEDARCILPNAIETMIVVSMNCRSLINFFSLRCCNRSQDEIRTVANLMLDICKYELPIIFKNVGAKCEKFKLCTEGKFTCGKYPLINTNKL